MKKVLKVLVSVFSVMASLSYIILFGIRMACESSIIGKIAPSIDPCLFSFNDVIMVLLMLLIIAIFGAAPVMLVIWANLKLHE